MTLTDGERDTLNAMDDHGLAEMWLTYADGEDRARDGRKYVEYLFFGRMTEREADAIASPGVEITLTHPYDVDANALMVLGEHLEAEQLAAAYTAPEQVWTAPKWNMTVLNSYRKLGKEIRTVIDDAKQWQPAKVRVKRKAVKT